MNIAFFCDAYLPTKNGVASSAHTSACQLRALGHRVVIFAPRFAGYRDADPDVVRFAAGHWIKAPDYPVTFPFMCRVAPRSAIRFRREKFDLVHVHSPFVLGNLGAHWARFHFLPLVWTFHTLYHHYIHYSITPPRTSRWYILWRVRRMLERCDRVIAPSHAVERVIARLRPGTPTQVLPTGIDIARFAGGDRLATRAAWGVAPDETLLLYAGRLAPEKNLGFLMRALAPVLRGGKARLMLAGGGPDLEAVREHARRLEIADRVCLPGFVAPERMPDFYAAGDLFVFASRTETQGISIAEAFCAGLPCVVVNAMGAAEAVEHEGDGLLVPAQESRFREAVQSLMADPERRARMSARARERAGEFSKERRVAQLLELYQEVVATKNRENSASIRPR